MTRKSKVPEVKVTFPWHTQNTATEMLPCDFVGTARNSKPDVIDVLSMKMMF